MSSEHSLATPCIILCAGGTGGHLFPAVSVAQKLKAKGCAVHLMTDVRGTTYVPQDLFESVFVLPTAHLSINLWRTGKTLQEQGMSALKILRILKRIQPKVLWGFGGKMTLLPLLVARIARIPIGLYQADAILGQANRFLLRFAKIINTSVRKTWGLFPSEKVKWVGIPVREGIVPVPYTPPTPKGDIRLLVIGGSQGARIFSTALPTVLKGLPKELQTRLFLHQQCRPDLLGATHEAYKNTGIRFKGEPFIEDIGAALAQAHLVVARSGASTLGELMEVGRPALFIPYPHAKQNHQMANCQTVVTKGGGWCASESALTSDPSSVVDLLTGILEDPNILTQAAAHMNHLRTPDASEKISECILGCV
jgi:UDP-N-acetylglucosamine--N-acetylmuramyl-(pentapeptide) pyrophosphoryl-undecaprenol N-acetylglucosamine transferase